MKHTEQIDRISYYESLMQEAVGLLRGGDPSEQTLARLRRLTEKLETYYTGDDWKRDFADDEAGLLPKEIKRGVLSEDGLYNLLEAARDFRIEALLEQPWWVIDALPEQVPTDSPGQYFAVERHYLAEPQLSRIKQRHIDLVLKLNCYRDVSLDGEATVNPAPERIASAMRERHVCILLDDALLVSEPDELCLALYHPDEALLALTKALAVGEGLYVWQPEHQRTETERPSVNS